MRAWHPVSALLLALALGCPGPIPPPSKTPPTTQQKQQALTYTATFMAEATAHATPDTFTPPAIRAGSLVELARTFALGAAALPLPAHAMVLTPCTGNTTTTGLDASGYTTSTTDFGACTDGSSGQILTRWKQTADSFELAVTYNAFTVSTVVNGGLVTVSINGGMGWNSTHSGMVWTTYYSVPRMDVETSGGGHTAFLTHVADLTATFTQTSSPGQPVVGDYSLAGTTNWFNDTDQYQATIDPATPLLWKDLGSGTACAYPVSGHIAYDISSLHPFGLTFTSSCGTVKLDDGSSVDLHSF